MNPLVFGILLLLAVAVFSAPRRWVIVVMLIGVLYLTQGQSIVVAGASFFPSRILSYLCFFRVMGRGEFSFGALSKVDWAFFSPYLLSAIIGFGRGEDSVGGIIARTLDVIFGYVAFRGLISRPIRATGAPQKELV